MAKAMQVSGELWSRIELFLDCWAACAYTKKLPCRYRLQRGGDLQDCASVPEAYCGVAT